MSENELSKFNIEFLDLKRSNLSFESELKEVFNKVLHDGVLIGGPYLAAFEREFAAFCRVKFCVGVGNGLDALKIALMALDIGPGDEVIVPAFTFIATWLAVSQTGARVIPVDVDADTALIDLNRISAAITPRTKAIIAVHLFGEMVDITQLKSICGKIAVIEDAAQAHGSRLGEQRAGAAGTIGCFSFYPTKNLGALGDGGALTTDDMELAEKARQIGNYGSKRKYYHEIMGLNSRLDPLQAAFLSIKLLRLNAENELRAQLVEKYRRRLESNRAVRLFKSRKHEGSHPSWHLFVIRHEKRDELRSLLQLAGVQTLMHYPESIFRCGAYSNLGLAASDFPVTEQLNRTVLSLPLGSHLSLSQVEHICSLVDTICERL